jgi:hypothetical protein
LGLDEARAEVILHLPCIGMEWMVWFVGNCASAQSLL